MNITQHSCDAADAGDAGTANKQRERRRGVVVFDAENDSRHIFAPPVKCSQVRATFNTLFTSEMFFGRRPNSTGMRKGERLVLNANILILFE